MPMPVQLVPHTNVWVEREGNVVLSRWRVQLLEAIRETGSISAAARRMDVEYHRAWEKLEEMERGLGQQLVERQAGGPHGGGASLTEAALGYVERFNAFARDLDDEIAARFEHWFAEG